MKEGRSMKDCTKFDIENVRELKPVNGYRIFKCSVPGEYVVYDVYSGEDLVNSFRTLKDARKWCL